MLTSQIFSLSKALLVSLIGLPAIALAQNLITPGSKDVNASLLHEGVFDWALHSTRVNRVQISKANGQTILSISEIDQGDEVGVGTYELNPDTLAAQTYVFRNERGFNIKVKYGSNEIAGTRVNAGKKQDFKEPIEQSYFPIGLLPQIVSCLPLKPGYEAVIPVVRIDSDLKPIVQRHRITKVSEMSHFSDISGAQRLWRVELLDRLNEQTSNVYVNQQTRRIVRWDFYQGLPSSQVVFYDNETNVNPIRAKFNPIETMAMLTQGSAKIEGQAYTFEREVRGLNLGNKKQFPPKGAPVILIPNTAYFKEWIEFNISMSQKSSNFRMYPLPAEVSNIILVSNTFNELGNFEFKGIKSGEYLVYVSFDAQKHLATTNEKTGGYTLTVTGSGTGSITPNTALFEWFGTSQVASYKAIKVNSDSETLSVTLTDNDYKASKKSPVLRP